MRIAVVGATGVLGRNTIPRLVERGHRVRALVRQPGQAAWLARLGIDAVVGDILEPASLPAVLAGCDAALHLATAVPRPGMPRDFSGNDRIRREGTRHLVAACRAAGVARYVQQSIAHIAADGSTRLLDETAPLQPAPTMASTVEMEATVRDSGLAWSILRGGAFYGPGTGRDEDWRGQARDGRLKLPGDGEGYISLIHVEDMADAVALAAERAPPQTLVAVVDDEPVTYRVLLRHIAALERGPEPASGGPPFYPSFRVANARARSVLGWAPAHASFRSGYV